MYNPDDVRALIARMKGRCKADPAYGTMLPMLLEVCFERRHMSILDVGIGYYTSVVLAYLFGDRVTSVEKMVERNGAAIISWDGASRVIEPWMMIDGDIWVVHDVGAEGDIACKVLEGRYHVHRRVGNTALYYGRKSGG